MKILVTVTDEATPILAELRRKLDDRTGLHEHIAAIAEVRTRRYIIEEAAPLRHKTAERLGAQPTGYLSRRGEAIESTADKDRATVILGGEREIFARVLGDVTVKPVTAKYLAIPASAESYGKRPREFDSLRFVPFPSGARALVDGKSGQVQFWLKQSVTLPQDRGLIPPDEQFIAAAEQGARDYLKLAA